MVKDVPRKETAASGNAPEEGLTAKAVARGVLAKEADRAGFNDTKVDTRLGSKAGARLSDRVGGEATGRVAGDVAIEVGKENNFDVDARNRADVMAGKMDVSCPEGKAGVVGREVKEGKKDVGQQGPVHAACIETSAGEGGTLQAQTQGESPVGKREVVSKVHSPKAQAGEACGNGLGGGLANISEGDIAVSLAFPCEGLVRRPEPEHFEGLQDLHIGTVRIADEMEGFSKVVCPGSGFDCDVHVHSSVADPEVLAPDDVVAFKIHVDAGGVPQAVAPFWKLMGWDGQVKPVAFGAYYGRIGALPPNGCCIVVCPEVSKAHGSDASVRDSVMSLCALTSGDTIAFDLQVEAPGRPHVALPLWRHCFATEVACLEPLEANTEPPVHVLDPAAVAGEMARAGKRHLLEPGHKKKVLPRPKELHVGAKGKPPVAEDDHAIGHTEAAESVEPDMKRARTDAVSY